MRTSELGVIGYYKEPLQLEPPKPEKKADLKKAFEEAAGIETSDEGKGNETEQKEKSEDAS